MRARMIDIEKIKMLRDRRNRLRIITGNPPLKNVMCNLLID
jgi:hypothetical protein